LFQVELLDHPHVLLLHPSQELLPAPGRPPQEQSFMGITWLWHMQNRLPTRFLKTNNNGSEYIYLTWSCLQLL
jgi:hypothetical protein